MPERGAWPGKADTLAALRGTLRHSSVPPFVTVLVGDWRERRAEALEAIAATIASGALGGGGLAVRSSAADEDGAQLSAAGRYATRLDVPAEPGALARAIDEVAASLPGRAGDAVVVQAMVRDPARSGVVFTRDPGTGAPYLVVELDEIEESHDRTDAVTGGRARSASIAIHHAAPAAAVGSPALEGIVAAAHEVAARFPGTTLDLELAQDRASQTFLLQARPLTAPGARQPDRDRDAASRRAVEELAGLVIERSRRRPGLAGSRTILGQMPDWNPAELLGAHPSPLAASLFGALISDRTFHRARRWLGYRALPREPLVVLLAGRPYVDVRVSLNSLLPQALPVHLEEAAVDAMLDRLAEHPELHDRLEFDVAPTALDFGTAAALRERYGSRLDAAARATLADALRELTRGALSLAPEGSLARCLSSLEADGAAAGRSPLRGLPACRRDALRFAVVARHAFIAEALLRSAADRGAIAPERLHALRRSVSTVAGNLARDLAAVARGTLERSAFLLRYGHLRPGTFDVRSARYDRRDDVFAHVAPAPEEPAPEAPGAAAAGGEPFAPTGAERAAIDRLAHECGLAITADELVGYARLAISGRERAKFAFARRLSDLLEDLAGWAEQHGIDREELSHATLDDVRRAVAAGDPLPLREAAAVRRAARAVEDGVRLGPLVRDARDLWVVRHPPATPSFVGSASVSAPPVVLDARSAAVRLAGRIACISSADPGFDWIFASGVAGLVTRFGGGNSHMAIRCWELGVPAALGVGDPLFERLATAALVELSCAERIVRQVCPAASA